jgi:DNA-binding NtrC family response regulator
MASATIRNLSLDSHPRLLVVEDVPDAVNLLSRLLAGAGYRVVSAFSVEGAMRILDTTPIDLAICDVMLPDGSAFDILPTLEKKHIATIGMSGFPSRSESEEIARGSFVQFILKPVPFEILREAITQALRGRAER